MKIANVREVAAGFQVFQHTGRSQTAVMTLPPGRASSSEMNKHETSDQILLVVEGEVHAKVGEKSTLMKSGDFCLIPAGTLHRFENKSDHPVITFNVYAPPEYPADEKE